MGKGLVVMYMNQYILKSSFKSTNYIQKEDMGHTSKFRLLKPHQ